jgi:glycine oxidase
VAAKPDVVVVGAGVMGCSAAYWLSKAGCKVLLLEKEAVAVGASGMASAHWFMASRRAMETLVDVRLAELFWLSYHLHEELAHVLPQESGIDIGYREHPAILPAFAENEAENLMSEIAALGDEPSARWLEGEALWEVEPRLSRDGLGGVLCQRGQVIAYKFVLALLEAAERRGVRLRHGEVAGLRSSGGRVSGVQLSGGEIIATGTVVLAMGPWSQQAAAWIGFKIPVYPVRGQLLHLRVPDPQLNASMSHDHMYLTHKSDGVTVAGTTYEPDSGFDNRPTLEGLESIMEAALRMAPSLEDAQVIEHISGLRPGSGDTLPLIGPTPGWQGLYMVAGHDRNGMGLSLISTRFVADLITEGHTPVDIEMFDPGRFGPL